MPFGGASVSIEVTRNDAHGRNNCITFEIYGDKGSIAFNYERMDEIEEMFAEEADDARGFRTVYTGPADPTAARFGRSLRWGSATARRKSSNATTLSAPS